MRLSDFLYFVPLTLTALSIIVPAASDSYSNLSPHYASSIHGQFGDLYDLNVSCTEPVSIFYNQLHRQDQAIRIQVQGVSVRKIFPILFSIKQQKSIMSFQVPVYLLGRYNYNNLSRILCPAQYSHSYHDVAVDVSTMSPEVQKFSIRADLEPIYFDNSSNTTVMTVSPAKPSYLEYHIPQDVWSVVVRAESTDDLCSVMSIQEVKCPVYDMVDNVEFVGFHQTVTRSGAITIESGTFHNDSFFIVFVVKPNDFDCNLIDTISHVQRDATSNDVFNRTKIVRITVTPSASLSQLLLATLAAFGLFALFYIIAFVFSCVCYCRNKTPAEIAVHAGAGDSGERQNILRDVLHTDDGSQTATYGATATTPSGEPAVQVRGGRPRSTASTSSSEISVAEDNASLDLLHDVLQDRDIVRTKTCLCVADLSTKPHKILSKKYDLYFWNLVSLAIFYILPVIQLVITYQSVLNKTGDQDICYYNFLCAYRLSFLTAFNNVYSNIGYIMLGFLFLLLVYRRDSMHKKKLLLIHPVAEACGIPQHFGVFYAMGVALVMEGVLSGCYHVCPSYNNFQFDTAFMYMIGCLIMIKIYQTRHPDVNAHAHSAYCFIALIVFMGVMGVTEGNQIFWIVFIVMYVVCILMLTILVYYVGRWRLFYAVCRDFCGAVRHRVFPCSRPLYTDRMVLLVLGNVINFAYAGYGLAIVPKDFASYLLGIVLINLNMYFFFYIIMKLRRGEKILKQPLFYIISGAVVWGIALYFFFKRLTSWQVSPAMSRVSNEECLLLNFYDSHDIWHFLSSTGLFLSFMLLLTLEDDLADVPRSSISVF